jgi:hypothetical protein
VGDEPCGSSPATATATALMLGSMAISEGGRAIEGDRTGCFARLAVPLRYSDAKERTKRRWAEGYGWRQLSDGRDLCRAHTGSRPPGVVDQSPDT